MDGYLFFYGNEDLVQKDLDQDEKIYDSFSRFYSRKFRVKLNSGSIFSNTCITN